MTGITELLVYAAVSFVVGWLLPSPRLPNSTPSPSSNPLRDALLELLKKRLATQIESESKAPLLDSETQAIMELIRKQ